jgi:hypothetical protein
MQQGASRWGELFAQVSARFRNRRHICRGPCRRTGVAGSNPVSPTSVSAGQRRFPLIAEAVSSSFSPDPTPRARLPGRAARHSGPRRCGRRAPPGGGRRDPSTAGPELGRGQVDLVNCQGDDLGTAETGEDGRTRTTRRGGAQRRRRGVADLFGLPGRELVNVNGGQVKDEGQEVLEQLVLHRPPQRP